MILIYQALYRVSYQSIGLDKQKINDPVAIIMFRIVQELLNNILKHAAASTAIVQVSLNDDTLYVQLKISVRDLTFQNSVQPKAWAGIIFKTG